MSENNLSLFQSAADQVRNRISAQQLANWLGRSHWWVGGLALLAVLLVRLIWQWRSNEIWLVFGILGGWILVGCLVTWRLRPDSLRALAVFDRAGNWKDQYSSALAFASSESVTNGEQLHINSASKRLPSAIDLLPKVLPIPSLKLVWLLPVLAIVFAVVPLFRPAIKFADRALSKEMKQAANDQSESIRKAADDLDNLSSLDATELAELKQLKSKIQQAAEGLAAPEAGQTTRELLTALESRARAAEKLAEKMGLGDNQWASDELVRELGRYTDTADLAVGIKDRSPAIVANQADLLADTLNLPDIKRATLDRLTIGLERSLAKAIAADQEREIGKTIASATASLSKQNAVQAGDQFRKLGDFFRQVNQRTEAQEKLQRIAAQLRSSGSQISGSQLGELNKVGIKKQAKVEDGLQPIQSLPTFPQLDNLLSSPQLPQPGLTTDLAQLSSPVPGSTAGSKSANAKTTNPNSQTPGDNEAPPIPGESSSGKNKPSSSSGKVGSEYGQGGGLLSAPIPGESKASPIGAELAGNSNQSGPGIGGNKAGGAKMDLFEQSGTISKASKDAKVKGQILNQGESEFREVESGELSPEQAQVKRREIMREFIDVEEQALDEQPLPINRRKQVLRYFSELRKRLETDPQ